MKKILFAAYSLDIGGIEKALVTLINYLMEKGYDVTIVLEKKQGIFLDEINKNVKIIEYTPDTSSNLIKRKFRNLMQRIKFVLKYKNKYEFSASFATYSIPASFISRTASKNNCLWVHSDYLTLFANDVKKVKNFFNKIQYSKFKNIMFVSNMGKEGFMKVYPNTKKKIMVCNNLINENKIKELSREKIDIEKDKNNITFLNVGRHSEKEKKLTRIIEAAKMLKKDGMNFKILFVGEGPDTQKYIKKVKEENLENNILFLGKKRNPYPYFNISDCVILTSDYEGYPVVFLESFVLNKPIITTKVSDYKDVENAYGYVTNKNTEDIYEKMKLFIEKGFEIQKQFDANSYNEEILNKIEKMIEGK